MEKKPILVIGAHRAGTTWVGKIISTPTNINYVHEPFNIDMDRPYSPFTYWFEYMNENSTEAHEKEVLKYLRSFLKPTPKIIVKNFLQIHSVKDFGQFVQGFIGIKKNRTVIKDPIAVMSAEWIYRELNADVVAVIRHPAAFVASLKVKGWEFDFNNWASQSDLMKDYLSGFETEINQYTKDQPDLIDGGILLYRCIYYVISEYQKKYDSEWYFVRHEDLSRNPVSEYEKLFEHLNIEFSASVKDEIIKTTTASKKGDLKRDAVKNIHTWKNRLSDEEIERIRNGCKDVWSLYYTEEDWI